MKKCRITTYYYFSNLHSFRQLKMPFKNEFNDFFNKMISNEKKSYIFLFCNVFISVYLLISVSSNK